MIYINVWLGEVILALVFEILPPPHFIVVRIYTTTGAIQSLSIIIYIRSWLTALPFMQFCGMRLISEVFLQAEIPTRLQFLGKDENYRGNIGMSLLRVSFSSSKSFWIYVWSDLITMHLFY